MSLTPNNIFGVVQIFIRDFDCSESVVVLFLLQCSMNQVLLPSDVTFLFCFVVKCAGNGIVVISHFTLHKLLSSLSVNINSMFNFKRLSPPINFSGKPRYKICDIMNSSGKRFSFFV